MDTLILQLLCGQLRVSGGCRMDDQTLNVSNICQQRKDLQLVNELKCCFLSALDIEGEDGCAAVREVLLVQSMIRVVRQRRMVYMLNLRVIGQELNDLLGVLNVTLDTQRQSLSALQQQNALNGEMVAPVSRSRIARM